jgi:O-antigen ligase
MLLRSIFHKLGGRSKSWLDNYTYLILISSVVGYLSFRGWTNITLFLLLVPAAVEFKKSIISAKENHLIKKLNPIVITLALPFLTIAFSQALQQEFILKRYDGPSRILLSIPLLLYFTYKKIDFAKLLGFAAPISTLLLIPVVHSHPEVIAHWEGRFATAAVDPTAFGTYSLVLTAFCFFSMEIYSINTNLKLLILQTSGLLAGLYLLLGSSTRGSWLAIPPLVILWLFLNRKMINARHLQLICLTFFIGLIMILHIHPNYLDRVFSGLYEISSWLEKSNTETSTGFRLTMWQISWELFKHNPFYGYGDNGFRELLNEPWITSIASPEAREIILFNGPHNEFLANLIRSGFMGGLSVLCLFFIPLDLFWRNRNIPQTSKASHLGLSFITCLIICSISSEVLTLKYTNTFYGLIIASLTAQIFQSKSVKDQKAS